jgi:hypothetical protein
VTGRLQFQNQDGSIHEKDFKHDDEIGGVSGIWEILRHDDEVAVTGKKSIKELVIGSMKVALRWVLGNRSKLAKDFIWPHGGRIGTSGMYVRRPRAENWLFFLHFAVK